MPICQPSPTSGDDLDHHRWNGGDATAATDDSASDAKAVTASAAEPGATAATDATDDSASESDAEPESASESASESDATAATDATDDSAPESASESDAEPDAGEA